MKRRRARGRKRRLLGLGSGIDPNMLATLALRLRFRLRDGDGGTWQDLRRASLLRPRAMQDTAGPYRVGECVGGGALDEQAALRGWGACRGEARLTSKRPYGVGERVGGRRAWRASGPTGVGERVGRGASWPFLKPKLRLQVLGACILPSRNLEAARPTLREGVAVETVDIFRGDGWQIFLEDGRKSADPDWFPEPPA